MEQKRINEFIHSSLVSSTHMAYVEDAHGTLMLLENMNEVLRYITSNLRLVTLFCELDILEKYITIQKVKYSDRFSVNTVKQNYFKSIFINHMSLVSFFDEILFSLLEQNEVPVDFTFTFDVEGNKPSVSINANMGDCVRSFCRELI